MNDLAACLYGQPVALGFQRRKDAASHAQNHGWYGRDVELACTRFCSFWIVSILMVDQWRILDREGNLAHVPFRGYVHRP